jgi:hypothetical protein
MCMRPVPLTEQTHPYPRNSPGCPILLIVVVESTSGRCRRPAWSGPGWGMIADWPRRRGSAAARPGLRRCVAGSSISSGQPGSVRLDEGGGSFVQGVGQLHRSAAECVIRASRASATVAPRSRPPAPTASWTHMAVRAGPRAAICVHEAAERVSMCGGEGAAGGTVRVSNAASRRSRGRHRPAVRVRGPGRRGRGRGRGRAVRDPARGCRRRP